MQTVLCPHCTRQIKASGKHAGHVVSCPACGQLFQLQPAAPVAAPAPASPFDLTPGDNSPSVTPRRKRRSSAAPWLLLAGTLFLLALCVLPAALLFVRKPPAEDRAAAAHEEAMKKAQLYDDAKERFLAERDNAFRGMIGRVDEIPTEILRDLKTQAERLDRTLDEARQAFDRYHLINSGPGDEAMIRHLQTEKVLTISYITEMETHLKDR